jgi:hypothetical protein
MKQHYNPQFLLKSWTVNNIDGKLESFNLNVPKIPSSRTAPKFTGYENDLFALSEESVYGMEKQFNETKVFKYIDNHGAIVKKKIENEGINSLSDKERNDWTLFMMSLISRQPEVIENLKGIGKQLFTKKIKENPEEYQSLASQYDPVDLLDFVNLNFPGLIENFGLYSLKGIVNNLNIGNKLMKMNWFIRKFNSTPNEIILSDNPCIRANSIDKNNFVLALPINPQLVFFVSNSITIQNKILKTNEKTLCKRLNQSSINQASSRVYASSKMPTYNFIKNHLRKIKTM